MKSALLALTLFTFQYSATAQITLKNTYSNSTQFQIVNLEIEGHIYTAYNSSNGSFNLYNPDHSLLKTVHLSLPSGSNIRQIIAISEHLFNSDDDVEFFVSYSHNSPVEYEAVLFDQSGTKIQTLPDVNYLYPKKVGPKWVMVAQREPATVDIYECPGQYLGIKPTDGSNEAPDALTGLYPNPMDNAATLKYALPQGINEASLEVYNTSGQKLRTYQVSSQFQDILIQRNELPAGNYFYKLNASGMNSAIQKFTIK